jgi:hypothetical protein
VAGVVAAHNVLVTVVQVQLEQHTLVVLPVLAMLTHLARQVMPLLQMRVQAGPVQHVHQDVLLWVALAIFRELMV